MTNDQPGPVRPRTAQNPDRADLTDHAKVQTNLTNQMNNLGLKINLETIVSCWSFCFMQKIGPKCGGLSWGWFRVVQTWDRCVWYAWLGWLQQHCWAILIFVLYAPVCRMHQTSNGKATLLPNTKNMKKICTCSVPTSVLEYPEISTKMCCLQRGSYEREKSYKEKKYNLSGWNVHRLVMIVIKNSSGKSNEETRAVDKEKKTLYISLWGLLI